MWCTKADLDPEFLKALSVGNSQNKLFYRADDIDTAYLMIGIRLKKSKIVTRIAQL